MKVGFDVGSTTIKYVVTDEEGKILHKKYERHFSKIDEKFQTMLHEIINIFPDVKDAKISVSGSAGMGISDYLKLDFVQEVYAVKVACSRLIKGTDVIIELGGEDAKILFLTGNVEVRMNGSCAGGTGAFIDQMASLLGAEVCEIDALAKKAEKIYPIASRCGVFAKSDIQPLLNQGAKKEDIAASILHCVVTQTVAGLAQGRKICGNIVYLGGPLTFMPMLKKDFDNTLKVNGTCPENSLYYVALGAAFCAENETSLQKLENDVQNKIICKNSFKSSNSACLNEPLFLNKKEYQDFKLRHNTQKVKILPSTQTKRAFDAFIGIDAGSTTFKGVLTDKNLNIVYKMYQKNTEGPVNCAKKFLQEIYELYPNVKIVSSAVTGYGEELIKNAFGVDFGIVETMAHFIAAKRFMPNADLIIDIGGQDIKCFKVNNGIIEDIFLNEACSSGCGSFLQTFANSLGYSIKEFSELALFAKKPVDLGSRCTVFMNSSVKQAQKDGAGADDIAAGLAISVVKNALYKVIRARSKDDFGKNIVVQGGTFLSDAVLRAFEKEIHQEVIRPNIAELMGAYGCAVWAKQNKTNEVSKIINKDELDNFYHKTKTVSCGMCVNNCGLTVNYFSQNKKFISGNNCQRPILGIKKESNLNIYEYKRGLLAKYSNVAGSGDKGNKRGIIGIPMALNMYENLPFWAKFWSELGFEVKTTPIQAENIYSLGNDTIPSDTVCFPAKLVHGHIKKLLKEKINIIFYPCMSYNFDEGIGDNHYNCPVVAYYPETIAANIKMPNGTVFIKDYVGLHNKKAFPFKIKLVLEKYFKGITTQEIKHAAQSAYKERELYLNKIREKAKEIITCARAQNKEIIILAGRPYHVSPQVNHNIDKLIVNLGAAVICEDSIDPKKIKTNVLNQWAYHARLYAAADFAAKNDDVNLVQLISFGCGIDAITSDEVRELLENKGKIYTQIKIDEITNLGTVKIRLRSLFAAIKQIKAEENICLGKIKKAEMKKIKMKKIEMKKIEMKKIEIKKTEMKSHKECFLQNKIKKITQSFCQLCSRFTLN